MLCSRMIPNCPIALDDIKNSNTIFGPNVPSLKGKMVRRQPKTVVLNYVKVLKDILQLHKIVSVTSNIMFIN